jgi:Predicted membrane protein (DUF2142)
MSGTVRSKQIALALSCIAAAVAVLLTHAPTVVIRTDAVANKAVVAYTRGPTRFCQRSALLPRGTSAIRISLLANTGPRVTLKVLAGSRVLTQGSRDAGWGSSDTVTVPVRRVARAVHDVEVCTTVGRAPEASVLIGSIAHGTAGGHAGAVTLQVEYLRVGHRSWWSLAASIAGHMGRGHALSGTWVVALLIALMAAVAALASWALLGRRARAAWACALIACLSAACWSLLTPPFQTPDEPSHFAYVQQLAEAGRLPTSNGSEFSPEENAALQDLHHDEVRWHPEAHTIASPEEQMRLQQELSQPLPRQGEGAAGVAASQPPLYYTLETLPYLLGSDGTLLDRLELMRLLSALLGGLTALFAYLFVRETLPGAPWAWTVGGLGVALAPLLGFMSGSVNPDALLYAVCAALFYCLARAFRRGLTRRLALATGALIAVGFLTKLNFLGLAPGAILGLILLTWREVGGAPVAPPSKAGASRTLTLMLALALAVSPACVYLLVNLLSNRAGLGLASEGIRLTGAQGSVLHEISYIWQFYLPRLPGMANDFPGISTTRQVWFDRSVGLYGWLDSAFPVWVYNAALIPAGLIALLCVRALLAARVSLRGRLAELAVYAVMGVGVLLLVGADSYLEFPDRAGGYAEPRYLLPLLPLLGAVLALAARGAGRRWGPVVGTSIVLLVLAQELFSQLLVVARFYG